MRGPDAPVPAQTFRQGPLWRENRHTPCSSHDGGPRNGVPSASHPVPRRPTLAAVTERPEAAGRGRNASGRAKFSPLEYRDPSPAPWLIHALGVVNRLAILPGLLKITRFDLPAADRARL